MARSPTDEEYANYDGMHCSSAWKKLGDDWQCPVCDRTKRQIMFWGVRKGANATRYGPEGFTTAIHGHHDHGVDWGEAGRFPRTNICAACNQLDSRLKKEVGTVSNFSFSPDEMRLCLRSARPNEGIARADIDFDRAARIYAEHHRKKLGNPWAT